MPLLKIGFPLVAVRGKLGAMYFCKDETGFHIKTCPRRTSTSSPAQQFQRYIFSRCTAAYVSHNWTSDELKAWEVFSLRHFTKINISIKKNPTVQNLFVGYNCVRVRNGLPIVYVPPND